MSVLEGKEELIEMHENPGYEGKNQKTKKKLSMSVTYNFFFFVTDDEAMAESGI